MHVGFFKKESSDLPWAPAGKELLAPAQFSGDCQFDGFLYREWLIEPAQGAFSLPAANITRVHQGSIHCGNSVVKRGTVAVFLGTWAESIGILCRFGVLFALVCGWKALCMSPHQDVIAVAHHQQHPHLCGVRSARLCPDGVMVWSWVWCVAQLSGWDGWSVVCPHQCFWVVLVS